MEFFSVTKVPGGFAVVDFAGEAIVAYRDKATAEKLARNHTLGLFSAAEEYDLRLTAARAYLAERAARPAPAAPAQLNLF